MRKIRIKVSPFSRFSRSIMKSSRDIKKRICTRRAGMERKLRRNGTVWNDS